MQFKKPLVIDHYSTASALGFEAEEIWGNYLAGRAKFSRPQGLAHFDIAVDNEIERLLAANKMYSKIDRTAQVAILTARRLVNNFSPKKIASLGINIGSSRGATALWEQQHQSFLSREALSPFTSPSTTAGNISSWVAQDLGSQGLNFSHSVTCSTGLHAILNAAAWLGAGFSEYVIAGAAECPLTPFTIAQMKALKIWSRKIEEEFPSQPLAENSSKESTFLLGEGCALFLLMLANESELQPGDIVIESCGFANEITSSPTAITEDGSALRQAMQTALQACHGEIDVFIPHSPGTVLGDRSELAAYLEVFKNSKSPAVTSNKFLFGHTFAAAGTLSLEMAILMLRKQHFIGLPYPLLQGYSASCPEKIERVMINATGFGGNAVSLVVRIVK